MRRSSTSPHPNPHRAGATRRQLLAAGVGAAAAPLLGAQPLPRLVTVSGAITEVVYALDAQAQLVGTDTTSLFPEAAQRTPKVGYLRQLSAEGLLSLRPQVLIATTEAGPPVVLDQVRSAGVRVELIAADHTWAEVQRKVQVVGRAAARESAARALLARLDDQWSMLERQVRASTGPRPRVLFVLAHNGSPQVAGGRTAAHAMLGFAGALNALTGFDGYRPMTAEALASAAPDFILSTQQGIDALGGAERFWSRPELALTPAYRRRALVTLDALLLLGFGPRLPDAIRDLRAQMGLA